MVKEKYLPYEEPEKEPEPEKTPQEIRRMKLENFWYYNHVKVWIGLFIVIMGIWTYATFLSTVKPDYNIGVIVTRTLPEYYTDRLSAYLEKYGQDLNGDGVVKITVNEYILNSTDKDMYDRIEPSYAQLSGDLPTYESMIFLCDEINLAYYALDEPIFSDLETGEELPEKKDGIDKNVYSVKMENTPLYEQDEWFKAKQNVYFAMRPTTEKYQLYHDQCRELLERMKHDDATEIGLKQFAMRKEELEKTTYEKILEQWKLTSSAQAEENATSSVVSSK